MPPFRGSKNLRDTEGGIAIEFLVAGEYPGDGKPKPIAFPDPADVGVEINGLMCINLIALIDLKLASGMTSSGRLKDLVDIHEICKRVQLGTSFAVNLNAYVSAKFLELVEGT